MFNHSPLSILKLSIKTRFIKASYLTSYISLQTYATVGMPWCSIFAKFPFFYHFVTSEAHFYHNHYI